MTDRYEIRWEIDIEADSPEEAVRQAMAIQRNPESIATVFEVYDDCGQFLERVDLSDYDNKLPSDDQWTAEEQEVLRQNPGPQPFVFNMFKPKEALSVDQPDKDLNAEQLECKYNPEGDGEHPEHTRLCWMDEVAECNTLRGYWQWVESEIFRAGQT